MEVPNLTSIPEEKNLISKKEYKFSINETDYLIQIGANSEHVIINVRPLSSASKNYYEGSFTLVQLQKLSKSFRYYDSINELISNIMKFSKQKNIQLKRRIIIWN